MSRKPKPLKKRNGDDAGKSVKRSVSFPETMLVQILRRIETSRSKFAHLSHYLQYLAQSDLDASEREWREGHVPEPLHRPNSSEAPKTDSESRADSSGTASRPNGDHGEHDAEQKRKSRRRKAPPMEDDEAEGN